MPCAGDVGKICIVLSGQHEFNFSLKRSQLPENVPEAGSYSSYEQDTGKLKRRTRPNDPPKRNGQTSSLLLSDL